jgi:HAD superfamily hydrolase (TIGR01549 family)
MQVDTIFLDAGGVLLHPNWQRVAAALERCGVTATSEQLARAEPRARFELDTARVIAGRNDTGRAQLYFDLVLRHAGIAVDVGRVAPAWAEVNAYHTSHNLWEVVPGDILPSLVRLRRLGMKLVVVSNSNGTLRAHLDRLGLGACLDLVVDSHEEGIEKPDPRLFATALARAEAQAATTIHVGDLFEVDVVGARAAGLRALLFDPPGLYADRDCPRVTSLAHLADLVDEKTL